MRTVDRQSLLDVRPVIDSAMMTAYPNEIADPVTDQGSRPGFLFSRRQQYLKNFPVSVQHVRLGRPLLHPDAGLTRSSYRTRCESLAETSGTAREADSLTAPVAYPTRFQGTSTRTILGTCVTTIGL